VRGGRMHEMHPMILLQQMWVLKNQIVALTINRKKIHLFFYLQNCVNYYKQTTHIDRVNINYKM
jgi:hypothetical protein